MIPLVVPDVSILLKWVLPRERETLVAEALILLEAYQAGRIDFLLPSLWLYEAGNVLALNYPDLARERLEVLINLNLPEERPDAAWRNLALELVLARRVSFYDAAYHALAIHRRATFLTADKRYVRKVAKQGNVCHLSDWSLP